MGVARFDTMEPGNMVARSVLTPGFQVARIPGDRMHIFPVSAYF